MHKYYNPNPSYKEFVISSGATIKEALNLHNYRIKFYFVDKISEYGHHKKTKEGCTAETETDKVYLEIEIWLSRKAETKFYKGERRELVEDICHELCHVLTDPLYDYAVERIDTKDQNELTDINEKLTQKIAVILTKNIYLKTQ